MTYCHLHNLVNSQHVDDERKFGIRVTLPKTDTFNEILGNSWENQHWFRTEAERDSAFAKMSERHGYYRKTDTPTQVLEKIER